MTIPEKLGTMHKNDLIDMFPVFSNLWNDTCYVALCSLSALRRL